MIPPAPAVQNDADEPPAPTPDSTIRFAQQTRPDGTLQGQRFFLGLLCLHPGGLGLCYLGLRTACSAAHAPPWAAPCIAVVLLGGALGLGLVTFVRWYRLASKFHRTPLTLSDDHRIRVVAWPDDQPRFARLDDTPFEPRVFHLPFAITRSLATPPRVGGLWLGGMITVWAGMAIGLLPPLVGMAAFAIGLAAAWLWPVYLRVVPGRVEVVRYPLLARSGVVIERYDLRRSRVVVDVKGWGIEVVEDGGPGTPGKPTQPTRADLFTTPRKPARPRTDRRLATPITFVSGRWDLAEAVIQAAVSTAEAPALPEETLTG